MSFFNTLQQYVSSGVASLNISPRRFTPNSQQAVPPPHQPPVSPNPGQQQQPQRHPHLVDRSSSLKVGTSSPHHQRRLSPARTGSLKETVPSPSVLITSAAGQSFPSGGGASSSSSSSAAAIPPVLTLRHHHQQQHHNAPSAGGSIKKREPIKILPTFATRDGGPRRTSWPQFAITGSG